MNIDVPQPGREMRSIFPYFKDKNDKQGAYLDNAASTQKPQPVIDRLTDYLAYEHANIHRGAYNLSAEATASYDKARAQVASFITSPDPSSVIFTRGATEAINLVASSWGSTLKAGDKILLTVLEHHSNIVPWQLLAKRQGVELVFVDIKENGELSEEDFLAKLDAHKPRLCAFTALSNALGTVVPFASLTQAAHDKGSLVLLDAAQAVVHMPVDVSALDVDFMVFSAHKMYGPTGIGALYGKPELLNAMPPYQGGGDMIERVTLQETTFAKVPERFEAGTQAIAEAIAFGTATEFVTKIGLSKIAEYENELFVHAYGLLSKEKGVRLLGPGPGKQASIISFTVDGLHPHDLATFADSHGVQFRAGHHCAMPLMERLKVPGTARISFGIYNAKDDIEALIASLRHARKVFNL